MKLVIALLALVSSQSFASGRVVLDCNISFGPDQEVTVRQTPKGLVLEELTNTGSTVSRPLSQEELKSGVLKLRIESPFDSGTMTLQKDGQWLYDIGGAMGYADCNFRSR